MPDLPEYALRTKRHAENGFTEPGWRVISIALTQLVACNSTFSRPFTGFRSLADRTPVANAVKVTGAVRACRTT